VVFRKLSFIINNTWNSSEEIESNRSGIRFENCESVFITKNNLSYGYYGLSISESSDIDINMNTFNYNLQGGIELYQVINSKIYHNTCIGNGFKGIAVMNSLLCKIVGNKISGTVKRPEWNPPGNGLRLFHSFGIEIRENLCTSNNYLRLHHCPNF